MDTQVDLGDIFEVPKVCLMSLTGRLARFGPRQRQAASGQKENVVTGLAGCSAREEILPVKEQGHVARDSAGTGCSSGVLYTCEEEKQVSGLKSGREPACEEPAVREHTVNLSTPCQANERQDPCASACASPAASDCPLCGVQLSTLDSHARAYHVNTCLDSAEQPLAAREPNASYRQGDDSRSDIRQWLTSLGLERHSARLQAEAIDVGCLPMLSEEDLESLNISCPQERRTILRAARLLNANCSDNSGQRAAEGLVTVARDAGGCAAPGGGSANDKSTGGTLNSSVAPSRAGPPSCDTLLRSRPSGGNKTISMPPPAPKPAVLPHAEQIPQAKRARTLSSALNPARPKGRHARKAPPAESHESSYQRTVEASLLTTLFVKKGPWRGRVSPSRRKGCPRMRREALHPLTRWLGQAQGALSNQVGLQLPNAESIASGAARLVDKPRSLWSSTAMTSAEAPSLCAPLAERIAKSKAKREAAMAEARAEQARLDSQSAYDAVSAAAQREVQRLQDPERPGVAINEATRRMQIEALKEELKAAEQTVLNLKGMIADLEATENQT